MPIIPTQKSQRPSDILATQVAGELAQMLAVAGVQSYRQAKPQLTAEIERARRYNRPLAILCADVSAVDVSAGGHASPSESRALLAGLLSSMLRETLRSTDIVTYSTEDSRCLVMLPETGRSEAVQAMKRIDGWCASRQLPAMRSGVGIFPEDAWTLDDLIELASKRPSAEAKPERVGVTAPLTTAPAIDGGAR